MADVRSMLRAERAARTAPKIATQKQATRLNAAGHSTSKGSNGKKRKIDDDDSDIQADAPKRSRGDEFKHGLPAGFFDKDEAAATATAAAATAESLTGDQGLEEQEARPPYAAPSAAPKQAEDAAIDEDEWAAFQRDIALPPDLLSPPRNSALSVIKSSATISAAPMTAAEIEAQRREDQKDLRKLKEEEIEGEKEDAARNLESEFDEMEALEERVKRLKDMRERLKTTKQPGSIHATSSPMESQPPQNPQNDESDNEDDDDDEADWDDWKFGRA